jgi:hypothetical protein
MLGVSRKRGLVILNVSVLGLICLILPLAGVRLSGRAIGDYLHFPPLPHPMNYPLYHPGAFWGFLVLVGLSIILWFKGYDPEREGGEHPAPRRRATFPWWGWLGLILGIAFWVLAWTRFDCFVPYQPYTFILQWLSLIFVMNALSYWRRGHCPIADHPVFFLKLFPASAALWWVFEYLNRFVNNWLYEGASYARNPLEYVLFATIAFSTVLPGVYSTKAFLETFSGLQRLMARGPAVPRPKSRVVYVILLVSVSIAFFLISWYPKVLYPLLWIGPFVGWMSVNRVLDIGSGLGGVREGDWCAVMNWSLAALICGVFWEMWNYYSMSKWTYQVPYLHVLKIFEMPLAGYFGYLAFGLECAMAVEITRGLTESRG